MLMRSGLLLLPFCLSLGCAQFPDLDAALSPDAEKADYPDLVPVEELRARLPGAEPGDESITTPEPALTARVAALRARAETLRGRVIDPAARARLTSGAPQI